MILNVEININEEYFKYYKWANILFLMWYSYIDTIYIKPVFFLLFD